MTTLGLFLLHLAWAVLIAAAAPATATIIDSYSNVKDGNPDAVAVTNSTGNQTLDFTIAPTVTDPIGSGRRLSVSQFSANQSADLTVNGGVATFGSSSNATSLWTIFYGVLVPGGLHFDATDSGNATAFKLTFSSFDTDLEYLIGAYGYTGTGTSYGGVFQPLSTEVIVPFSSFSNAGTIGFSDLNQIEIRIRDGGLTHGGSATLTHFQTIPEPSTYALLVAAALCAPFRQRRRLRT